MFEENGFKLIQSDCNGIEYINEEIRKRVMFGKSERSVCVYWEEKSYDMFDIATQDFPTIRHCACASYRMLKLIDYQLEELGWLDE